MSVQKMYMMDFSNLPQTTVVSNFFLHTTDNHVQVSNTMHMTDFRPAGNIKMTYSPMNEGSQTLLEKIQHTYVIEFELFQQFDLFADDSMYDEQRQRETEGQGGTEGLIIPDERKDIIAFINNILHAKNQGFINVFSNKFFQDQQQRSYGFVQKEYQHHVIFLNDLMMTFKYKLNLYSSDSNTDIKLSIGAIPYAGLQRMSEESQIACAEKILGESNDWSLVRLREECMKLFNNFLLSQHTKHQKQSVVHRFDDMILSKIWKNFVQLKSEVTYKKEDMMKAIMNGIHGKTPFYTEPEHKPADNSNVSKPMLKTMCFFRKPVSRLEML